LLAPQLRDLRLQLIDRGPVRFELALERLDARARPAPRHPRTDRQDENDDGDGQRQQAEQKFQSTLLRDSQILSAVRASLSRAGAVGTGGDLE